MASDYLDDDDSDDEYFAEFEADAELTGKEPKFVLMEGLSHSPMALGEMKVDQLIALYISARNQMATDTKGYKLRKERVKTHLEILSSLLRQKGDDAGVDTFATANGTAFRQEKEKFSISDWLAFSKWLDETKNFQTLQKRVSPNAVKEIRDATKELPPGVERFAETVFSVRSPSARKRKTS